MARNDACKQSLSITGVILAGGMARRMGGRDKALLPLSGHYLIEYCLRKLKTQIDTIIINANRNLEIYQSMGFPVISDSRDGFAGPLAGIATAMKYCETSHIFIVPCDSPFIPSTLVERFVDICRQTKADICVAHDGNRLQPVFGLIHTRTLASLEKYLDNGHNKIDTWYKQQSMSLVDCSDIPDTFININTPQDLEQAEQRMKERQHNVPVIGFAAHSGTGKTTLLKKLIPVLKKQYGQRIGLVKHAHHGFEIDIPGKDSYELRKAGASQVIVGSQQRWAHIVETPDKQEKPTLQSLIDHFDHENLDLILIEGFKLENIPKIEVFRPRLGKQRLSAEQTGYIAIATDDKLSDDVALPIIDLNDIEQIADFILDYINKTHER